MSDHKKVTIELTADQRDAVKDAWGVEIDALTYDKLEERFAPSMPPSVMRKLDDLGRGDGSFVIREPGGGLE
jgi:hypothetical protein